MRSVEARRRKPGCRRVVASDAALHATIRALTAETRRPSDARSLELQRHFLSAILLWVERWYDATRTERRAADAPGR